MAEIFISYRRDDEKHAAGRLRDEIAKSVPPEQIFMDVDAIPPGADYVEVLEGKVAACNVLLAVIGPGWLEARDEHGNLRLDNPEDFVRIEIGAALAREINVVPVLLDGTNMPPADSLPDDLKPLTRRQAAPISHDRFSADVHGLLKGLRLVGERVPSAASSTQPWLARLLGSIPMALAKSPRARNRPVSQLHEIVDKALLPDKAYASELVLNVMHPRTDHGRSGYIASVDLSNIELDQALLVRKVLTAGASLGLVTHVETSPNEYLIRSELVEYISSVRARESKLGNLSERSAIPKYAKSTKKTLPRIENKSTSAVLLEVDETRRRYIGEIFDDLRFDHADEHFLEILIFEHDRIEGALTKLFRADPQIKKHLLRKESEVARQFESAHERIMNRWIDDRDIDYQVSKIKRQDIKSAIILSLKLPHLRDDLQREIENSKSRALSDPEIDYYNKLENARQAVDLFLDTNGQEITAETLIDELESFEFVTKPI